MIFLFRNRYIVVIITVIATLVVVIGVLGYMMFSNIYMQYVLTKKANSVVEKLVSNLNAEMYDYSQLYNPDLVPNESGNYEGVRGNGLNLMLLNTIQNRSYIQEYMQIMVDNESGKFTREESTKITHYAPFEMALAMAVNEVGYYNNSGRIPKSMLPFSGNSVVWNEEHLGYPAEAMTLNELNSTMSKVRFTSELYDGTYQNLFHIHRSYFPSGGDFRSSVNGYGMSKGRYAPDRVFLPDSLNYLNSRYSNMINTYNVPDEALLGRAMYAVYHNGGEGQMSYYATYGVTRGSKLNKSAWRQDDYVELMQDIVARYEKFAAKNDTYKFHISAEKGYGKAFWMYYDEGFYIDNTLNRLIKSSSYRKKQLTDSYLGWKGETLSESELYKLLDSRTKEPWEVGYVNFSTYSKVYGDLNENIGSPSIKDVYDKGTMFKFSDKTSSAYSNKVNGEDPKVLMRVNQEVAGYVWDSLYSGKYIYAELLLKAGVGVDPTDVNSYYRQFEGEYIPSSGSFADIMNKIGVKFPNAKTYEALEFGYSQSGNWYFYGGGARIVDEDAWSYFISQRDRYAKNGIPTYPIMQLYETKDGTDPSVKHNRRNENLVNYGKRAFDCSSFVRFVYNSVLAPEGNQMQELSASGMKSNTTYFTNISNKSERRAGDVFNSDYHIYFYLADNTTGSTERLSAEESRTEKVTTVGTKNVWTLEAAKSGTRVGIRSQPLNNSGFILKRLKALE